MKKLGHLFYRAFHSLDIADYIPMVSLTYSSALYTSCKLIVGARDLNRFRLILWQEFFIGGVVEFCQERNHVWLSFCL